MNRSSTNVSLKTQVGIPAADGGARIGRRGVQADVATTTLGRKLAASGMASLDQARLGSCRSHRQSRSAGVDPKRTFATPAALPPHNGLGQLASG